MEREIMDGKTLAQKAVDFNKKRYDSKNAYTGILSGFSDLDRMTFGFQNSDLIIIGSRPGTGKTALALSLIKNIAIENKISCGFISLEESCEIIGTQLIAQTAEINPRKLIRGMLKEDELRKALDSAEKLFDSPVYILDRPRMNLSQISELAGFMVREQNVKILFIDYLNLIETENRRLPYHDEITEIAVSLKILARELKIPVVVLCQLNPVKTKKEPDLEELRKKGDLEKAADVLLFLHRNRSEESNTSDEAKIIVSKNKNGLIGDAFLNDLANLNMQTILLSKAEY